MTTTEPTIAMAMRMHDVQYTRANRIEAERDQARRIACSLESELAAVRDALLQGGQTADVRCRAALAILMPPTDGAA